MGPEQKLYEVMVEALAEYQFRIDTGVDDNARVYHAAMARYREDSFFNSMINHKASAIINEVTKPPELTPEEKIDNLLLNKKPPRVYSPGFLRHDDFTDALRYGTSLSKISW